MTQKIWVCYSVSINFDNVNRSLGALDPVCHVTECIAFKASPVFDGYTIKTNK